MDEICKKEKIKVEAAALSRLGRAAAGSMRDGLSLLDQAIAFGDEKLADDDVAEMLGSMDHHRIIDLIEGLVNGDGSELLERVRSLDELVPDYETVLDELATALQRIAVIQLAGVDAVEEEEEDVEALQKFAEATDPAFIQLLYQIAITSRRDLSLAPDSRLGFEMAMLRMIAFRPAGAEPAATGGAVSKSQATSQPGHGKQPVKRPAKQPGRGTGKPATSTVSSGGAGPVSADAIDDWPGFADSLALEGAARQLAENTALELASPFELRLSIQRQNEHLLTDKLKSRLVMAIQDRVGEGVRVHVEVVEKATKTVAARTAKQTAKTLQETKRAIQEDPNVRDLVDMFGAEVISESIRPGTRSASRE
jgi:DNA polymerase-3 subunit gamma/tau